MTVTACQQGVNGHSAYWIIWQPFEVSEAAIVSMLGSPDEESSHDFDGSYTAPSFTTDGGLNIEAQITSHPTLNTTWAVQIDFLSGNY